MPRFVSRKFEIEAYQWYGQDVPGVQYAQDGPDVGRHYVTTTHGQITFIEMGDWIIQEPDGNGYYPCKPDIFVSKYERVSG